MGSLPLHPKHLIAGATFSELRGREVVTRYGEPAAEYAAVREQAGVIDLSFREWLRVNGPDRVEFLHGMVTNDVNGLPEGHTNYAALLTNKGAMVADTRVWRRAEDLLLDVEPGFGVTVKEALEKYLISEDAEIHLEADAHVLLGVYGPQAGAAVSATFEGVTLPGAGAFLTHGDALITAVSLPVAGFELRLSPGDAEARWTKLVASGARPFGFDTLEVLRVEAGVPRYGQDMEEKTIPLEAGLDRAIHYKKGCYIGQEVIARATFRGHMNRRLVTLKLDATVPPMTELRAADKKVGWVTSVVRSPRQGLLALGYLHRDLLTVGTQVALATGGNATVAAVAAAPSGQ